MRKTLPQPGRRLPWIHGMLIISAIVLTTSAIGKTVTYGLASANARMVMHQITRVTEGLALWVVLAELAIAVCLVLEVGSRQFRGALLFALCCSFLSYRIVNGGDGACGCFVHPALLNAASTRVLEGFAWASLAFMLAGGAAALLVPNPPLCRNTP